MTRVPLASGSLRLLPSLYPDHPFPTLCSSISIRRPPARTLLLTMSLRRTWHYELDSPWSRLLTWIIQAGRLVDSHHVWLNAAGHLLSSRTKWIAPSRGSGGRGRRGRRERRGRLIRNEFEVTSTGIIGGQESWNYSTVGQGEKIGTIPGGISPFDFVYSSFIGGIIGLICNLDSFSALSSSTGSILVQGRGGKRGRRSNFQASDTTPCNWRFNEREGWLSL